MDIRNNLPLVTVLMLLAVWILSSLVESRPHRHGHKRHRSAGGRFHRPSHEELEEDRKEAFKMGILSRMGLDTPPDISSVNVTADETRAMLRAYRQSLSEQQGQYHELYDQDDFAFLAKQYHSVTAVGTPVWDTDDGAEVFRINMSVDIPQPEDGHHELGVHSSTLFLYRMASHPENMVDTRTINLELRIDVYQILEDPELVKRPLRRLIDSRLVSLLEPAGWESFDIKQAMATWLEDPALNYGLEITAGTEQAMSDVVTLVLGGHMPKYQADLQPHVSIYTQEIPIIARQKRMAETYDCKQGDGESRCCRYPLWISFKDIGWEKWVVQPEGYQAFFCDGSCPRSYKVAHNFATIKSLIHEVNPAAAPPPCCTASKLSPITLLHYNMEGHLVVSVYEDMVVEQCKCA